MRTWMLIGAAVSALALSPAVASAQVIDLGKLVGSWDVQVQSGSVGDFFAHSYYAPVDITAIFTDFASQGDEYNLYINGTFVTGVLSPPDDGSYTLDPNQAFASGKFTRGVVNLFAGDMLSFQVRTIPSGLGDSTLAVTALAPTSVPEPTGWGLMIGGFALAGAALRSRTRLTVRYV